MPARISSHDPQIDRTTGRDVARGIGERLKQAIGPEAAFPDQLQKLVDEMRAREARPKSPVADAKR